MINYTAILFDMDGVLIDSLDVMEYAWTHTAKKFGLTIAFEDYLDHIGKPFFDILSILKINPALFAQIKENYGNESLKRSHMARTFKHIPYVLRKLYY